MFYAASEIVFWILLAAVIGGGIGYGLSQAKMVRLNRRLAQGRADAPLERELAIAWDTIEDLNKRLQVAHETIRDVNGDLGEAQPAVAESETDSADEPTDDSDRTPAEPAEDDEAELDRLVAEKMAKAERTKTDPNGVVGTRLSERVAASRSKSVDFTDGLEG